MLRKAGTARSRASRTPNSLTRQVEGPAVAGGGVALRVEGRQAGGVVDAGPGGGLAAGQGADAEHELGEVEGFGQVVVGAEGEAAEWRSSLVPAAVSIEVSWPAASFSVIIRHRVSPWMPGRSRSSTSDLGRRLMSSLAAALESVIGDVDSEALVAQPFGDVVGQAVHVFDDQDPHGVAAAVRAGRAGEREGDGDAAARRAGGRAGPGCRRVWPRRRRRSTARGRHRCRWCRCGPKPGQKVVLITGASTGIGRATAERYGKNDAHVLLLARNAERLDAVATSIRKSAGRPRPFLSILPILTPSDN